ncbi:uncharacterized protein G2W53_025125 [Senna tora]|uniref:RNase H type-1 domain-containing protein n=1 Tax=Senna tora TaxID=362788 RepID=A0A834TET6_9FABA|nr:uncharacterized protein G2W53_025125 [Senna tora]
MEDEHTPKHQTLHVEGGERYSSYGGSAEEARHGYRRAVFTLRVGDGWRGGVQRVVQHSHYTVWKELNEEDAPSRNNACATNLEKWQPPSWRFLKLNVDASMREGMPSRVGCIIRNHTGRCLVAMTKRFEVATTVDTLEALAVYEGLMLAKSMSILNIEVEGDSAKVFKLLNKKGTDQSYLGIIIEDILELSSFFNFVSFKWIRRETNKLAHILAHDHVEFMDDNLSTIVWLEDYPLLICNALRQDFSI